MLNEKETKLWKEKNYAQRLEFITGVFSGIKQRWDVTPCEHMAYPVIRTLINYVWLNINSEWILKIDGYMQNLVYNHRQHVSLSEEILLQKKMKEIDEAYVLALKLKEILDNPLKV